eukprot:TRINITY_DN11819_c0_g1_i5.p1 TRINITY_DN11819_c0_g1~~TRINITY_DN11819_c0_g1_i5.p1  ORF type:complete len:245 (-),score=69.09 TRINITY_DN11819_c0_g1_i5:51-755(-)
MGEEKQIVLVWGGAGALGSELTTLLTSHNIHTISVDIKNSDRATESLSLADVPLEQHVATVTALLGERKLDAVWCVAGGWVGDTLKSKKFLEHVRVMWESSVASAAAASHLAALKLKENGMLVLTGSESCLNPTPGMIAYGLAKCAVHHLVQDAAQAQAGLPENTLVVGILPNVLDTPANRQAMPQADVSAWTPLSEVANKLLSWLRGVDRPASGSLLAIHTSQGETTWNVVSS